MKWSVCEKKSQIENQMFERYLDLNLDQEDQYVVIRRELEIYLNKMIEEGYNECDVIVPRRVGLTTKLSELEEKHGGLKFVENRDEELVVHISWSKTE